MPGSQDYIQIIDPSLTKSEISEVIAALQPLKEEVKNFANIAIFTRNTSGAKEFREQAELLSVTMEKLKVVEQQLSALKEKAATVSKIRTDQEIADTQRAAAATRGRVKEILAENDAYKQLAIQYIKATEEAKRLAVQYGITSKEARGAIATAAGYGKQLKEVDASIGQHTRNVGGYAEGIRKWAVGLAEMLGPLYAAEKAYEFLSDSVKEYAKAQESASRLQNVLGNLGHASDFAELSEDAERLSKSLQTVSKSDVTETFQKLAIYGKLSKSQFLELTPVIANFAAKQRIDLPEATDAITKALEGNARSLKTYGINIKEGKDTTERFGIIMDQLKPKVDGAAVAFGETFTGSVKKSDIAIEELKVHIGSELAPTLQQSERFLLAFIDRIPVWYEKASEALGRLRARIQGFFGFNGLSKEFDAYDKIKADNKAYADQEQYVADLKLAASKRTVSQQKEEIANQKVLFKTQYDYLQLLLKTGPLHSKQVEDAGAVANKTNLTIKALEEELNSKNDTTPYDPNAKKKGGGIGSKIREFILGTAPSKNLVGRDFNDLNELANRADGLHTGSVSGNIASHGDLTLSDKAQQNIDDLAAHKKRMHDYEMQFGNETIKLSASLVKDGYEREINAIQKKIDLNNELHQKETKAIQSSTLSLQEKAAAQILLDARVSANNEQLKKKERDIKIKEAIFDKASTILQLEEQGAIAALAALKIPIYGEAEAIAIEAITQLQVAAVAARTIPTYAKGTDSHPGGPMIVGEKGPELRLDPTGDVSLTPGIPTLTFGERGTKIFTNKDTKKMMSDHVNNQMLRQMMHMTAIQIDNRKELNEIRDAVNAGSMAQIAAIRKRKPDQVHIHNHARIENFMQKEIGH